MRAIIALAFLTVSSSGANLPPFFFEALNQVEASGQKENVKPGDKGKAIGPLQIHYSYWLDSGVPGSYQQCTNWGYSTQVVTAYLNRHGKRFIEAKDYISLARIHNGGPTGYKKNATKEYARKFSSKLPLDKSRDSGKVSPVK